MTIPFSSAIQYMQWDEINCCRCEKYDKCDIQDELAMATMSMTRDIPDEIAKRAGLPGYKCLEKEIDS